MKLLDAVVLLLFAAFALDPVNAQTASSAPASTAATAVPALIRYSAVATDEGGKPLSGQVGISFLVFNQEQGGSPLWVETQTVTLDAAGRYQVELGAASVTGMPIELFSSGDARWLEVQIAGEPPQSRVLLLSVPYALKAADSATLGGLPPSAFLRAGSPAYPVPGGGAAPDVASDVTTTGGVSGYVPVFSGTNTIADSAIFTSGSEVGIGTTTPKATLDVAGSAIFTGAFYAYGGATIDGSLNMAATGFATSGAGKPSQTFSFTASSFDSATDAAVSQFFRWIAEPLNNDTASPTSALELLFSAGSATPAPTGLSIGANGQITFAPGQTFPGTSTGTITGVTAGTALTGGGTAGTVALNLDTTKVPLLAAANHFTGTQSITGGLTATGSVSTSGQLISTVATGTAPVSVSSTTVVPNLNASLLGGLAPASFAKVAAINAFSATQSFTTIGVGTATPRSLVEVQAAALEKLGPVLTLTNTLGGKGAQSALDFNTLLPSSTGTYNPMARIAASDNDGFSDNLLFQSNIPGSQNDQLETNLFIQSNGLVGINTLAPAAQLEVDSNPALGTDAIYGFGGTTAAGAGTIGIKGTGGAASGSVGVQGFGGSSIAANSAGSGGIFTGGFAEGTGSGGDGIDADAGGSEDTSAAAGYAGYFSGDVTVTGTISGGSKNFEIDHPLDPANKYLDHASVESSEMVNIYSGNVTTDELGIATVSLPEWFESVNTDFRYQLTVIGKFAQAIVSQEIANHQFKISTNASFTRVSWQVTGVRNDAFAKAHPLVVERNKTQIERGFYAHPELYGQPAEKQIQWARHPDAMRRLKSQQVAKRLVAKAHEP
jgi:hypothetical protein